MTEYSYGIIPFLRTHSEPEFLLIQHIEGQWGFPKGHPESDETPLETACRELEEEAGVMQYVVDEFQSFHETYPFEHKGEKRTKINVYFLAEVLSPEVTIQEEEIRQYAWLPFHEALEKIHYMSRKEVLQKAYAGMLDAA